MGLVNLIITQALYIYKLIEVVIIGENKNLIFIAFQIVVSSLKDFNDSQEFLIISLIPSLNKDYFMRKKSY